TGAPSGMGGTTAQHPAAAVTCGSCMSPVTPGHKFCGACGMPVELDETAEGPPATLPAPPPPAAPPPAAPSQARSQGGGNVRKTMFFGAMQAARAKLVLIKGDGLDGVSFTLAGDEHIAGRVDAALLFEEDPF